MHLPEPLEVPFAMKPLASARTSMTRLPDGRLRMHIVHDLLSGVTPEMLHFWFQNVEGDVAFHGQVVPRYRLWHPRDHVAFRLAKRTSPVGPGSVFHIHEVFGRDPRFVVNVLSDVRRLDAGGFDHFPRKLFLHPVHMTYRFERVAGGTRYENALVVGLEGAPRFANEQLTRAAFGEAHGQAWLLHNVEEVSTFEHFLPALYASARGGGTSDVRFVEDARPRSVAEPPHVAIRSPA